MIIELQGKHHNGEVLVRTDWLVTLTVAAGGRCKCVPSDIDDMKLRERKGKIGMTNEPERHRLGKILMFTD